VDFRSASACFALALVAGLLPVAPAAAAPSGWEKPVAIAGGGSDPDVVLTGAGGAAAVWESLRDHHFLVEGSVRVAGKWKPSSLIATDAFEPSIAAAGEGAAIAVWAGTRGVEATMTTPVGGWTSLPPIPHTANAFAPEVATDGTGRATVVWREPRPGGAMIEVATRALGGDWSATKRLSPPGHVAYSPHVAVDPAGAAVVIWRRDDGQKSIVQAATRDPAGHWSASVDLSAKGENAVSPAVAIDPAGEAVAVWDRFDGAHQIIQASTRRPHGGWSRPVDLSGEGRNAEEPKVALSPAGEAVAVWERFDGRVDRVQAATRARGGKWSSLRNLSGAHRSSHEPRLAIDGDGVARVVWMATEANGAAVEEASRPAGRAWSAPARIVQGPTARREATIAAASGGEAVVVWAGFSLGTVFHPASPPSP
jgi:hypothetical protein